MTNKQGKFVDILQIAIGDYRKEIELSNEDISQMGEYPQVITDKVRIWVTSGPASSSEEPPQQ